jgi:hypothetical protein
VVCGIIAHFASLLSAGCLLPLLSARAVAAHMRTLLHGCMAW